MKLTLRSHGAVCFLVFLAGMEPMPAGADATFRDSSFNSPDWTATKIYDDTSGQSATFSTTQILNGGNPGTFRETVQDYPTGNILSGHLHRKFKYVPLAQGAINSLDVSYDLNSFENGVSGGIGYGVLVYQNGLNYIFAHLDIVTTNSWLAFQHTGLTAADFNVIGGTTHPDFSATGNPIEFGYFVANGTSYGNGHTVSGMDNLLIAVNPQGPYQLNINPLNAATATLTWSTNAAGYVLESAGSLPASQWNAVTNSITNSGFQFSVTITTTTNTAQFFRLRK